MKKILAILFSAFYLSFSVGLMINLHYCGGKLKTVSLSLNHKDCCKSKKGKVKCCDNKKIVCKINDNQEAASHPILPTPPVKDLAFQSFYVSNESPLFFELEHQSFLSNSPPGISKNPSYLLNRVIRI